MVSSLIHSDTMGFSTGRNSKINSARNQRIAATGSSSLGWILAETAPPSASGDTDTPKSIRYLKSTTALWVPRRRWVARELHRYYRNGQSNGAAKLPPGACWRAPRGPCPYRRCRTFGSQEYSPLGPRTQEILHGCPEMKEGDLWVGEKPGRASRSP